MFMKKIFILAVAVIIIGINFNPALAAKRALVLPQSDNPPLQPAPSGISPNLGGNINYQLQPNESPPDQNNVSGQQATELQINAITDENNNIFATQTSSQTSQHKHTQIIWVLVFILAIGFTIFFWRIIAIGKKPDQPKQENYSGNKIKYLK